MRTPEGCAYQAAFRNPLADSGLLGVGAGAALGAVAAVRLGWAESTFLALPFAAFAGAKPLSLMVASPSTCPSSCLASSAAVKGMCLIA